MSNDFLVEIGTEELPPTALLNLSNSFTNSIVEALKNAQLSHGEVKPFATPRRLAVYIKDLAEKTPEQALTNWGPPKKVALDDSGEPTKAAIAFAKKNGIGVDELQFENDGKAEKLVHRSVKAGQESTELMPQFIRDALDKLPIPKRMRWGASRTEFVRPVHWIVMLNGADVINTEILGIKAGRNTRGHRFHCDTSLEIANPASYEELLKTSGHIIADFAERQAIIKQQVITAGESLGGQAVIEQDLLDEVTALVEWPVTLTGSFEERFLEVPAEALISSMAEHQKYFHVVDKSGELMPNFMTVANIESLDKAQVIAGNEKVIRPRLSDAAFFFETDKKLPLEKRAERLNTVVFQAKLGTLLDKAQRIEKLAGWIAEQINANATQAKRAGYLCKADLVSDMVLEFDKMQGVAGRYYALNDGEDAVVAEAIKEQYLPKFAGDKLPNSLEACCVALADRLDTLTGIFGIGQKPSGSKDPFALRRASLAVLRIIVEKSLKLDLRSCLEQAIAGHNDLPAKDGLSDTILEYMLERFRAWYEDEGIAAEVFMAVSAKQLSEPLDINQRVLAVNEFTKMAEAPALASANKRVSNILAKQAEHTGSETINKDLLQDSAEQALAEAIELKQQEVAPLFAERNYQQALASLASLQQPVDTFFDEVMVMCDDEALKNNRLAMLKQLRGLFLEVADISLLAG